MAEPNSVLTSLQDGVFTVMLNRPKVNAFNDVMISAAQEAFKQAERDAQVRCVLLTGAGGAFTAGQDITAFDHEGDTPFRFHLLRTYNPLVLQIRRLEKPVLAAVNGAAAGAGLGIALACDLRVASETARFVVGFSGIGLACDSAVSLLLPRLIGLGRATEMAYTNTPLSASQALAWGLVNRVVPANELYERALDWAKQLAAGPVRAFGLMKRQFNKAVLPELEQVLDYEAYIQDIAGQGAEHKEGVKAFLEKRPADFKKAN